MDLQPWQTFSLAEPHSFPSDFLQSVPQRTANGKIAAFFLSRTAVGSMDDGMTDQRRDWVSRVFVPQA
jgi:hypothetical protein